MRYSMRRNFVRSAQEEASFPKSRIFKIISIILSFALTLILASCPPPVTETLDDIDKLKDIATVKNTAADPNIKTTVKEPTPQKSADTTMPMSDEASPQPELINPGGENDTIGPKFSGLSLEYDENGTFKSYGENKKYAKGGDTIRISFDLSDDNSGVDFNSLRIYGTAKDDDYNSQLKNHDPDKGPFTLEFNFPEIQSPAIALQDGPVPYTLSVKDKDGNITQKHLGDDLGLTYYHEAPDSAPTVTVSKINSLPQSSDSSYLRAGETIQASFSPGRDLNTDQSQFYFIVNGQETKALEISESKGNYSAQYTINQSSHNGEVSWKMIYVDMAGNTAEYDDKTSFIVDTESPAIISNECAVQEINSSGGYSKKSSYTAGIGDKIKVEFTLSEPHESDVDPTVALQIGKTELYKVNLKPIEDTDRKKYEFIYKVTSVDQEGRLKLVVTNLKDKHGNTMTTPPEIDTGITIIGPTITWVSSIKTNLITEENRKKIVIDLKLNRPQKINVIPDVTLQKGNGVFRKSSNTRRFLDSEPERDLLRIEFFVDENFAESQLDLIVNNLEDKAGNTLSNELKYNVDIYNNTSSYFGRDTLIQRMK